MSRLCERPGCGQPANVSYGFDPARQLAWLEALDTAGAGPHHGALCQRHADAMVMPRGWWLDDRRQPVPLLFTPPPPNDPTPTGGLARPGRRRRAAADAPTLLDPPPSADVPDPARRDAAPGPAPSPDVARVAGTGPTAEGVSTWSPVNLPRGDLDGLLDVRSPLLSRAFGQVSPEAPVRRGR